VNFTQQLSRIQGERNRNGHSYEKEILLKAQENGFNVQSIHGNRMYSVVDKYSKRTFTLDGLYGKYFIEITTSAGDGKSSKIVKTSELIREQFPNSKFITVLKKIKTPRKKDGLDAEYDYMNSQPTIDEVLVGEEEFFRFLRKIRGNEGVLKIPFQYNEKLITKTKTNKLITKTNDMNKLDLIRTFVDAGDLTYAIKVNGLQENYGKALIVKETTPKTIKGETSKERTKRLAKERIDLAKDRIWNVVKPYKNTDTFEIIEVKDVFNKSQNEHIYKMAQDKITSLVNCGFLYYKEGQRAKVLYVDKTKWYTLHG